jgi:hypothetical protein
LSGTRKSSGWSQIPRYVPTTTAVAIVDLVERKGGGRGDGAQQPRDHGVADNVGHGLGEVRVLELFQATVDRELTKDGLKP